MPWHRDIKVTVLLSGHLMQDELAKAISSPRSHSRRAISSHPRGCLASEEKHPGCSGEVRPPRRGVFGAAGVVCGM